MGDVLSLIEKAQTAMDEKEAERLAGKMQQGGFDLNDLLDQMRQIKKMGSLRSLLSMMPGAGKIDESQIDEKQVPRTEAIILSMTPSEREKPSTINPSRKRRIAAGSGTRVEDVNRLLKQYEQMQKIMKQMGITGSGRNGKGKRKKMPAIPKELLQEFNNIK